MDPTSVTRDVQRSGLAGPREGVVLLEKSSEANRCVTNRAMSSCPDRIRLSSVGVEEACRAQRVEFAGGPVDA